MIIFESVSLKNFLSVGNNPVEVLLNKSPTTVIQGRNGQGKSCISDAINFALYGKPYRKINKPDLVNSINSKALEVDIKFTSNGKHYRIVRGIKPNIFEIYENGKIINQASDTRDYQEFLESNILGMNENAFKQIVLIGSTNYIPFMQLDTSKRKDVIEELLDIKIFSNMNILLKGKISSVKENIRDLEYKKNTLIGNKNLIDQQNSKYHQESLHREQSILDDIDTLNKQIITIDANINKCIEQISNLSLETVSVSESELVKYNKLKYSLAAKLSNDLSNQQFFNTNDSCPTCKQLIEDIHKQSMVLSIQSSIDNIKQAESKLEDKITEIVKLIDNNKLLERKIQSIKNQLAIYTNDKKNANNGIEKAKKDLLQVSIDKSKIVVDVSKIEQEINAVSQLLKDQTHIKDRYDIALKLLRDDGIKAKIIEQYIPQINYHVNEYLSKLGMPVQFILNENFEESIHSRYRDKFKYENFSEGEKARIDNALLLTWREIAKSKNTTNTNLLFMDEVFDSSLDSAATEELLEILSNTPNTNIFIISHKNDLADKVRSVIEIEKYGNFTRIKPQGTTV